MDWSNVFKHPVNLSWMNIVYIQKKIGFYSCSNIQTKSNFDFVIRKLCPGQLDYPHQNGRPEKKQFEQRRIYSPSKFCIIITILLSGDVHINPDPIKYPCTNCKKGIRSNQRAIQCDFCVWRMDPHEMYNHIFATV